MTPEEEVVQRLRRRAGHSRSWMVAIVLWACLVVGQIVALAMFDSRLQQTNDRILELADHNVLVSLLIEQSHIEWAMTSILAGLFVSAVVFGLIIGNFVVSRNDAQLTLRMLERIGELENQLPVADDAESAEAPPESRR